LAKSLAKNGINAMEDISDGLASEVINICEQSKKGAVIYKGNIPVSATTIKDAKKIGKNPYDYALYGGEDFELVFTASKKKLKKLKQLSKTKLTIVGEILPKPKGIYLLNKNKKKFLGSGYDHFKTVL